MKTAEELQAAVDEIKAVCQKHGIQLVGSETDDNYVDRYHGITFLELPQNSESFEDVVDVPNRVQAMGDLLYVDGIG